MNSLCSCVSVRSRNFCIWVKLCSFLLSFSTSSKGLSHEYLCLSKQKLCIWNVTQPVDDGSYNMVFFLFIVVNCNIFNNKKIVFLYSEPLENVFIIVCVFLVDVDILD